MAARHLGKLLWGSFAVAGIAGAGSAAAVVLSVRQAQAPPKLAPAFVLHLDLEGQTLAEGPAPAAAQLLSFRTASGSQLELRRTVEALQTAAQDVRVRGLVAVLDAHKPPGGLAQVQELRAAITTFRETAGVRAPTLAYAETFGEAGAGGTLSYYLASAFDQVLIQPTGMVSMTGLATTLTYFRGLLDRWRIIPMFYARGEYKSVASPLTDKGLSPASREATRQLLASMSQTIIEGISEVRGLEQQAVQEAINSAPLSPEEAQKLNIIDGIDYRRKAVQRVTHRDMLSASMQLPADLPQPPLPLVKFADYIRSLDLNQQQRQQGAHWWQALKVLWWGADEETGQGWLDDEEAQPAATAGPPVIALITLCGNIVQGKGRYGGGPHLREIASSRVCRTLRAVARDPAVQAVVLRIDSIGGSAVGTDAVHQEVLNLRRSGRPVIVSMGNTAASGAYYISTPATAIMAQPTSVTGSIGVVFGKLDIRGALADQGVTTETVALADNAAHLSPVTGITRQQAQQINAMMDVAYNTFVGGVAVNRKLQVASVEAAAKGRAWTGRQALQLGLVDQLGGLQDAIALAQQEAQKVGLTQPGQRLEVREYPPQQPFLLQLAQAVRAEEPSTPNIWGLLLAGQASMSGGAAAAQAVLAAGGGGCLVGDGSVGGYAAAASAPALMYVGGL